MSLVSVFLPHSRDCAIDCTEEAYFGTNQKSYHYRKIYFPG